MALVAAVGIAGEPLRSRAARAGPTGAASTSPAPSWHIVTDLFAFVATLVAGLVIYLTGWAQADAVATLVVAALMAVAAYRLLRDSARIFLEASPRGIEPRRGRGRASAASTASPTCTSCTSGR